jgi:DnaK suppressor protein
MSELSAEDLDRLREGLLEAKAELSKLIRTTESDTRPVDLDEPIGRLSRMDALQQQSMAAANRSAALLRHRLIEAAVSRVVAGVLGE